MPRLLPSRAFAEGILLYADDADNPLKLHFDYARFAPKPLTINSRFVPFGAGGADDITLQEWLWANGPGGAGTSIETPQSANAGACEYGEFSWLRRIGVAQPAGALVEIALPSGVQSLPSPVGGGFRGQLDSAAMYGSDLYITTRKRYLVKIPDASGDVPLIETDFGALALTAGITVFNGTGTSRLYVGCTGDVIREFDGTTWVSGAAGTERTWLETPYWTLSNAQATGGAAGTGGTGATRLVGTDTQGTAFSHVAGDPKVAANWSATTKVGPSSGTFPINRTVADNRTVWFGTGTGVYGVNSLGYSPNLTKWAEASTYILNASAITFWNGLIWFGHELGLVGFHPDGTRMDIGQFFNFAAHTGTTPIFGRPQVLSPSPDGLWVGYYNAANQTSYIGCLVLAGDGSYRWSMAEAVIPGQVVTFLRQVTAADDTPYLFIGTRGAVDFVIHLYRQYLPLYGGDPETDALNSGPYRAATDWSVRCSRWNGGHPVQKALRRITVEADYLGAAYPDNTVGVQTATDGAAFTTLGTATRSPRWTSSPNGGTVRATNVQVKLVVHNAPTAPVVLHTASIDYNPQPERTRLTTYPIVIGEGHTGQDPKTVLARLERAQRVGAIHTVDHIGRATESMVESVTEQFSSEAAGKGWTVHADVTLSTTRDVMRFDVGDTWDGGGQFS